MKSKMQTAEMDLEQTLACSLILPRIDYCNAVLYGAPSGTIQKLQRVQNNAARIVKSGATTISCQLAAAGAALAAGGTTHHLQAGRTDLQDTTDVSTGVSEPPHNDAAARGHL